MKGRACAALVILLFAPAVHAQAPGAPLGRGGARLNLVYPKPRAVLQQAPVAAAKGRLLPEGAWSDLCRAPCQSDTGAETVYRVAGTNMFPSRAFAVPPDAGLVYVDVDPANRALYWTGMSLTAVGSIIAASAIVLFNTMNPTQPRASDPERRRAMLTAFWLGPSLMLGGALLWAGNSTTDLTVRY